MPYHEFKVYEKITQSRGHAPLIQFVESKKDNSALFEGSSTGAKKIYVLQLKQYIDENKMLLYSIEDKKEWEMERKILKPYVEDSGKWKPLYQGEYILFPYNRSKKGTYSLIQEDILKEKYPMAWKYLHAHKEKLLKRADAKKDEWYRYSAARSLELYEQKNL